MISIKYLMGEIFYRAILPTLVVILVIGLGLNDETLGFRYSSAATFKPKSSLK